MIPDVPTSPGDSPSRSNGPPVDLRSLQPYLLPADFLELVPEGLARYRHRFRRSLPHLPFHVLLQEVGHHAYVGVSPDSLRLLVPDRPHLNRPEGSGATAPCSTSPVVQLPTGERESERLHHDCQGDKTVGTVGSPLLRGLDVLGLLRVDGLAVVVDTGESQRPGSVQADTTAESWVRRAAMRTEEVFVPMRQKPRVCYSTGQGVAGNGESEGPRGKRPDPSESEQTTSAVIEGRPTPTLGKPFVANNGGVGDAGMGVLGSQGDPGKPSVHPLRAEESTPTEAFGVTEGTEAVGEPKEVSREDQGGRWSRSTDGASCNGKSGKGSWLAEDGRRRLGNDARRERDVRWEGTSPTLCSRRPKGGKTGRSSGPVGTMGRVRTQGLILRIGQDSGVRETRLLRWGWRTAGRKPCLRPYQSTGFVFRPAGDRLWTFAFLGHGYRSVPLGDGKCRPPLTLLDQMGQTCPRPSTMCRAVCHFSSKGTHGLIRNLEEKARKSTIRCDC